VSIESAIENGRRLVATTFLDTGRVERRSFVGDGAGGRIEAWIPIATIDCRFGTVIDTVPGRYVDATFGPETAPILCALGQDIKEGDHIVNVSNGDTWLVVGDKTPASNLAVAMRINARRV
jgi:hypothetical protein